MTSTSAKLAPKLTRANLVNFETNKQLVDLFNLNLPLATFPGLPTSKYRSPLSRLLVQNSRYYIRLGAENLYYHRGGKGNPANVVLITRRRRRRGFSVLVTRWNDARKKF